MPDFEPPDLENDAATDLHLGLFQGDAWAIDYGLHSKLRSYLYHYNLMKLKCKIMATNWVVAAFIGLGFLMSGELDPTISFATYILVIFLSVVSVGGVLLLAFLDIGVYHRNIESIFVCQLELEERHPYLSDTMHDIQRLLGGGVLGPVVYDAMIYMAYSTALLCVAGIALVFHVFEQGGGGLGWMIGGSMAAIVLFNASLVYISKRSSLFSIHTDVKPLR